MAPSGVFLARAIAKSLPAAIPAQFRVLEVGPGTGAVTVELAKRMKTGGHLDLCEISPVFCKLLGNRATTEPVFQRMGRRLSIYEGDVRAIRTRSRYDIIVAGLPFSNFEPAEVQDFLEHFRALLKPGGALIWFEYVAIRRIQTPFVSRERRQRLKTIGDVTGGFIRKHQYRQQIVPINLPPARIRHLKFG